MLSIPESFGEAHERRHPGSAKTRTLQYESFVRQSAVAPVRFAWVHSNTKASFVKVLSPRSKPRFICV